MEYIKKVNQQELNAWIIKIFKKSFEILRSKLLTTDYNTFYEAKDIEDSLKFGYNDENNAFIKLSLKGKNKIEIRCEDEIYEL